MAGACTNSSFGYHASTTNFGGNNFCANNLTQDECLQKFSGTFIPNESCQLLGYPFFCSKTGNQNEDVEIWADMWNPDNIEVPFSLYSPKKSAWQCTIQGSVCSKEQSEDKDNNRNCICTTKSTNKGIVTETGNTRNYKLEPITYTSWGRCAGDYICQANEDGETLCVQPSNSPSTDDCDNSKDCEGQAVCVRGKCVGVKACTKQSGSAPCGDGFHCNEQTKYCEQGCKDDSDCLNKSLPNCLQSGVCALKECESDTECDAGKICSDEFKCVQGCGNSQCPAGQECTAHEPFICGLSCTSNSECSNVNEICDGGACRIGCTTSSQCKEREICRSGTCVGGCDDDKKCPDDQYCAGGFCNRFSRDPKNGVTKTKKKSVISIWGWIGIAIGGIVLVTIASAIVKRKKSSPGDNSRTLNVVNPESM